MSPGLDQVAQIKGQLESLASSLPVDRPELVVTRENLLVLVRSLPTGNNAKLVAAVTGAVMAKVYWLMADQTEYLIGRDLIRPPRSEAAQKRHEMNAKVRAAAIKGFADGDHGPLDELIEELIEGPRDTAGVGEGGDGG